MYVCIYEKMSRKKLTFLSMKIQRNLKNGNSKMRNRSDDRDGAISMTRQEARKGESQLKSEPRRGGGFAPSSREGVVLLRAAPAPDEFLTVAASGGQPRNAREFPGYAGTRVCIIIKRVRGRGRRRLWIEVWRQNNQISGRFNGESFPTGMKISSKETLASRFIVPTPPPPRLFDDSFSFSKDSCFPFEFPPDLNESKIKSRDEEGISRKFGRNVNFWQVFS